LDNRRKLTDVRKPIGAVAVVVNLAAAGCLTSPTPVIALGPWGGSHLRMDVTAAGARLEYDCAEGVIEERLRPDADGRFTAVGSHTPGHGGPIRVGEILPTFRARYDGRVSGDRIDLLVTITETGEVLGSFELRRGSSGLLLRCLSLEVRRAGAPGGRRS
jgi:hypothetical protein